MSQENAVKTQFFTFAENPEAPFVLKEGGTLSPVTVAYSTHGELNSEKTNAILVFHAFSGSHHLAGHMADAPAGCEELWNDECRAGWWEEFVGPGKAFDTDRYFIICANFLGSCYGSTSAYSFNPATDKPYGGAFPAISIADVVDSQLRLLDHLGIDCLLAAAGGSMGGMMALDLAARHPGRTRGVIPIATGTRVTTLQKMMNFEQVFAIEEDANFHRGDYYEEGVHPDMGLMLARIVAHKCYISLHIIEDRARGAIHQDEDDLKGYRLMHQVESYLLHHAKKFMQRFDANAYLAIVKMWQRFDLAADYEGGLREAFHRSKEHGHRFLVFTIDSDVCFYPDEQAHLCRGLRSAGVKYQHITIHSDKGHDSFLIEPELFAPNITYLLRHELGV